MLTRRQLFILFGGVPLAITAKEPKQKTIVGISSANGVKALEKAWSTLKRGQEDLLGSAIQGVSLVEDDPEDITVGYGGIPNEEGEVELDASCMDGKTHNGGAVAALRYIRHPSQVARLVMERTDHVLLVGKGALKFALAHGFKKENLLTEKARKLWLHWKETLSNKDDWLPPMDAPEEIKSFLHNHGTIHLSLRNLKGDVAGVTSTSGLFFKMPGRVGDSPIIGAGLYVDNQGGSCGATGRGEAVILTGASRMVVELLRRGWDPHKAVEETLHYMVDRNKEKRLKDNQGRPNFNVKLYCITPDGYWAAGAVWGPASCAIHDGKKAYKTPIFSLYQRSFS